MCTDQQCGLEGSLHLGRINCARGLQLSSARMYQTDLSTPLCSTHVLVQPPLLTEHVSTIKPLS
jgi:hypothetical protein